VVPGVRRWRARTAAGGLRRRAGLASQVTRSCGRPQLAAQGDLADTLPTDCWLAGALMKLES